MLCRFHGIALDYQHTQAIRARLIESGRSPSTCNKYLSALRGVLEEAFKLGYMDAERYRRAVKIKHVTGDREPAGRMLPYREIEALHRACSEDPDRMRGARDAAIVAVLYGTGLRRDELINLNLDDLDDDAVVVRSGKGNHERRIPLAQGVRHRLNEWLAARGTEPGPLFWKADASRRITPGRMSQDAVFDMLRKRARQAGIAPLSPHDLRRTFISVLLDAGADLVTVQRLAGHKQLSTTARYDRRGEDAKRRAVEMLPIP
jgi:site-specific recombinase XerD